MSARNTIESILARIDRTAGECWVWPHSKHSRGYGHVSYQGRVRKVHVLLYEHLVWPVGQGLELDHLCRNTSCCNPMHIEEVTHAENVRRGEAGKHLKDRTHCINGHEFDEINTRIATRNRSGKPRRTCRACVRDWARQRRLSDRHLGSMLEESVGEGR